MLRNLMLAVMLVVMSACTTFELVPKDYAGPTATVTDSGVREGSTKVQIFAMTRVEENNIHNAFVATIQRSQGQGFVVTPIFTSRSVQARPMKVHIRGSHVTGAPIHAIFSQIAGTYFQVEGVVNFSPSPNGRYQVTGKLEKEKASVWIEDMETGTAVTEVISK
jgi:hypothetical protein